MELLQFLFQGFFYYVFILLFALLLLVTLHEFGHYIVARWCGVRITKFSVGFGRELWGRTDKNGTRWSLSAIPAGGYVSIFGDLDVENPRIWDKELQTTRPLTPEEAKGAFCTKTVWQRIAIVIAGPAINFLAGILVLACLYTFHGQSASYPIVTGIALNDAAYEAGFRLGDEILAIDGKRIVEFQEVQNKTMKEPGIAYRYTVRRDGKEIEIVLASREIIFTDMKGVERKQGRAGMARFAAMKFEDILMVDDISTRKEPEKARQLLLERFDRDVRIGLEYRPDEISIYLMRFPAQYNTHLANPAEEHYDKIFLVDKDFRYYVKRGFIEAIAKSLDGVKETIVESYKRFTATAKGRNDDQVVAGVVKMSDFAAEYAKKGWYFFIIFLCVFSVQLAIVNLLPIPVLDGGYLIFLTYEAIRGRPVSQRIQNYALIMGLVLLGGIMIIANLSDFVRLLR